ncbi:DUF6773 family protein [Petrocella sp. FN5]|uniref:DUF6773 family protein n=1 Tax=Petrocella sp. FN5 TaxID=3032002 RepID=UPI0023D9C880|nr:DUF6773 family protein [Petrocella sp. FN5]MDF1617175.1 hypothetical protein [Petrocella sp. FN5]
MKKTNIQDERIISLRRKIQSDAFGVLFVGLLISILLQKIMFNAPFSQYAAEFILLMVSAIYVEGRNIIVGSGTYSVDLSGQTLVMIHSLVSGLAIAAISTTFNVINHGVEQMGGIGGLAITTLITFAFGALLSFIVFQLLYMINKKKQKQIDEKYLDADE